MPGQAGFESKLPVFCTPQQHIDIFADDPVSYKQILTIYNPYEFLIKFRVSCTDCSKYTVSVSQGTIKSNHSADIVLQHKAVIPTNIGVTDTIRIQTYTSGSPRTGGKKDITISLKNTKPRERLPPSPLESFPHLETDQGLNQRPFIPEHSYPEKQIEREKQGENDSGCNYEKVFIPVILSVALTILSLPKIGDETELPEILLLFRPSYENKLCAAFFLGMTVMYLLKKLL